MQTPTNKRNLVTSIFFIIRNNLFIRNTALYRNRYNNRNPNLKWAVEQEEKISTYLNWEPSQLLGLFPIEMKRYCNDLEIKPLNSFVFPLFKLFGSAVKPAVRFFSPNHSLGGTTPFFYIHCTANNHIAEYRGYDLVVALPFSNIR